MDSHEVVERYLQGRSGRFQASVKLVHCYDEWTTEEGISVQIGCGLTLKHMCQASGFLGAGCSFCGRPAAPQKVELSVMSSEVQDECGSGATKQKEEQMTGSLPIGAPWLR